jgi:protein-tyrosine phosphatase
MARESQRVAREHGIDPADAAAHRARALTDDMVMRADLTLTMTTDHRTDVIGRAPSALRRVFTVREFAALAAPLDDLQPADAAAPPRVRLAAAVARVAAQRGITSTALGSEDVFDPFGRSADAYDESARQLLPAVDAVAQVVRAALDAPAGAAR